MSEGSALCNVCKSISSPLEKAIILSKFFVQYYSCPVCGFIQTESPYWLDEAYSSAIARSDIGLIGRNIKFSSFCSALIPMFYDHRGSFLDYGGGNGMFVRMMRDRGFDFYWNDKYASNQFAEGFELHHDTRFSLLTAFEVFEHLIDPMEAVKEMLRYSDTVIFTTRLLPYRNVKPGGWWYFTLDTGQHLSLYTREALLFIAQKFGLKLSSNGISLHIISPHAFPDILLKMLSYPPLASALSMVLNLGRESLLKKDYYQLTGNRLDDQ